jgi:hypothetical protein
MSAAIDLHNKKFTRLQVIGKTNKREKSSGSIIWLCKCECGNKVFVSTRNLCSGNSKSCGCLQIEKIKKQGIKNTIHGASWSYRKGGVQKIYLIWSDMKRRCYNKNDAHYNQYGGRGIKVCKIWRNSFEEFRDYVLKLPNCPKDIEKISSSKLNMTIDRINNDKNYKPGNIKWSTYKEQANNRRNNRIVCVKGEELTLSQACDKYAVVPYKIVHQRINKYKWPVLKALTT